jgi:hypothetical protein
MKSMLLLSASFLLTLITSVNASPHHGIVLNATSFTGCPYDTRLVFVPGVPSFINLTYPSTMAEVKGSNRVFTCISEFKLHKPKDVGIQFEHIYFLNEGATGNIPYSNEISSQLYMDKRQLMFMSGYLRTVFTQSFSIGWGGYFSRDFFISYDVYGKGVEVVEMKLVHRVSVQNFRIKVQGLDLKVFIHS